MRREPDWKHFKFVTGNVNKVKEAKRILGIELEQVELKGLQEIQTQNVAEAVLHKLNQAYHELRRPVIVEDSGLVFNAWNGLPGALIKWFEQDVGCSGMLKMLSAFDNRTATAICCVALHDGKEIRMARGEARGTIAPELRGGNGFGWDVIFMPEGGKRTFAEMSDGEKDLISHRRRAFEELRLMLQCGPPSKP